MKEGRYNQQSWVQRHKRMPVVCVLHVYVKHNVKLGILQQSIFTVAAPFVHLSSSHACFTLMQLPFMCACAGFFMLP